MAGNNYYSQCSKGIGKCVRITTHDGKVHTGIIDRVTSNKVYLRPIGGNRRNYGGFGLGYYRGGRGWGGGWGWGWAGAAWGLSLGLIAALAFIPFF
ncbi:hypothetical protein [Niallia sp. NCCP-28]|uniref:hypothetical protein n=1 Tax=Niallia sp. NCCP-28 TaxID=2934712 RepID=UPI00208930D9|nr:hypothetical protein [Niallia sp. NCCP-28]GKU82853.1 hypothetical protein NCCP28_22490 [Niallia sp. NCCP-28]